MKRKLGAITIGQSPRDDVIPEMSQILGEDIEIIEAGALDGLTKEEISRFAPDEDDYILVSKLNDGTSVKFAEKHILPRLQNCIEKLEKEGAELILFICTGAFPDIFKSNKLIVYPQQILHGLVPELVGKGKLGIITPDRDQIGQSKSKWAETGIKVEVVAGSPYGNEEELIDAAMALKEMDVDLIVMDCIGYDMAMKKKVVEITTKPVVLARTIVARVVGEILEV